MLKITIIRDPFSKAKGEIIESDGNICDALTGHFESWPKWARLYHEQISESNDVTPSTEEEIERLKTLEGNFYAVMYPQAISAIVVLIIAVVIGVAMAFLFKPKIPNVANRNTSSSSPNNELSSRSNNARPGGRIPDIYGTVRSTPDLISAPYSLFLGGDEYELCMMCIGRGTHKVYDCKDGTTRLDQIEGSTVQVYDPGVNIYNGAPSFQVGESIRADWPPIYPTKSNSVNGQTLRAPNASTMRGDNDMKAYPEGSFRIDSWVSRDFNKVFDVGDEVIVSNAAKLNDPTETNIAMNPMSSNSFWFPGSSIPPIWSAGSVCQVLAGTFNIIKTIGDPPNQTTVVDKVIDLSGEFVISSVSLSSVGLPPQSAVVITLNNPSSVNPQWSQVSGGIEGGTRKCVLAKDGVAYNLNGTYTIQAIDQHRLYFANAAGVNPDWLMIPSGGSSYMSPTITLKSGVPWVGPFIVDDQKGNLMLNNFIALNGLYKDDGRKQDAVTIEVEVEFTPVDSSGNPSGPAITRIGALNGSSTNTDTTALTLSDYMDPGSYSIRARRITPTDTEYEGSVVDEVKWRDLYQCYHPGDDELVFPGVTVLRSMTKATSGALSVKERKLNLLVGRKIPLYLGNGQFTTDLGVSNLASDILCEVCRDPKIGNRPPDEIDYESVYGAINHAYEYFNTIYAVQFCYTFDKDGFTFEDTVSTIAQAVFCQAYRYGKTIRLSFERENDDSVLLFNHRNKIPNTETRTVRFGVEGNYDGLEYKWVNPEDDSIETMRVPDGSEFNNAKKIESIGVRNKSQAFFHAWRAWNKIKYQNTSIEFDSIAQGELVINSDRILVSDGSDQMSQDGDVTSQSGLIIGSSQPVEFDSGSSYTLHLQLPDATVQSMAASAVNGDKYAINMSQAPRIPLVVDGDDFTRTKYILVKNDDVLASAFLVTERTMGETNTCKIEAVNYDKRYYEKDGALRGATGA